jgi:hypothetical protein
MNKWFTWAFCLCAALVAIYFFWAKEFIAIDRCLDSGGAYDTQRQVCERDALEVN